MVIALAICVRGWGGDLRAFVAEPLGEAQDPLSLPLPPPDTACPGRTCYFHITNKTFEIKLAHFLLLFFGS